MAPNASERMRFGRYETLFKIASGGMADVFVARALGEAGFQKLVALKRMRPALAEDPRFVTMFLDEGRMAANIASPNVVATLDLGRAEDNSLYLVMELITGVALQDLIDSSEPGEPPLPLSMAIEVLAQTANGLHDAHEAHSATGEPLEIVHRDCSPHNILIDTRGQVKVTDFGIAKALERQTQSHAGEMKGKLCYLSPEQARGQPVDRRTDVFILGVVAYETLTGHQLFPAHNAVEALHKVVAQDIPRVDATRPEIPSDVAAAVEMALRREPGQRFATAAAFANALMLALPERAPRRELGDLIRQRGGGPLEAREAGIREALSEAGVTPNRPSELPPRLEPKPAPPMPSVRETAITEEAAITEEPAAPRRDSAAPLLLRSSRMKTELLARPTPMASPVTRAPRRGGLLALGAALSLVSFGVAAWLAWTWSRSEPVPVAPTPPPVVAVPAPVALEPTPEDDAASPTVPPLPSTTPVEVRPAAPEVAPSRTPRGRSQHRPTPRPQPLRDRTERGPERGPSTVGGHVSPRGDRAEAIDEINWD